MSTFRNDRSTSAFSGRFQADRTFLVLQDSIRVLQTRNELRRNDLTKFTHCSFSFDSNDDLVQQISPRLLDEGETGDLRRSIDLSSTAIVSTDRQRIVSSRNQSWRVAEISISS